MHATAARWASASDVLDGRRPTAYRVPGARRRRLSQPGGFVHSSRRSSPLCASVGALALAASSAPAHAQAVLETPSATVEVLGLKRWTVQMLQDSLAARAPGTLLTSGARDREMRRAARRLLVSLRGQDLGDDPRQWADWVGSL